MLIHCYIFSDNKRFLKIKSIEFQFQFCLNLSKLMPMLSGISQKQWRNLFDRSALYALFFHSIMEKLSPIFEHLINLTPGN